MHRDQPRCEDRFPTRRDLLCRGGFDHTRLTYRHASQDFRPTDVYGEVVHELIA